MLIYKVEHDDALEYEQTIALIHKTAVQFDLVSSLEQHQPARSHWHWQRRGKSGTLELTYDIQKHQLMVIVHDNRVGADSWAKKDAPRFADALSISLKRKVKKVVAERG
jgi:hypothetical protein